MYKLFTSILFLAAIIFALPVNAGSGHSHDEQGGHGHSHGAISAKKAASKAKHKLGHLAKLGKIDKSWASIEPASTETKTFNGQKEWVVMFKNKKIEDKEKQTLYLFYSLDGHYIATNYTGK